MFDAKPLPKRTYDIDKLIIATQKRIDEFTSKADILKDINNKLSNVWFEKGDIVLDRGGEKAIVCGINMGEESENTLIDSNLVNKLYVLIAKHDGYKRVSFDDIMPYNDVTKVLYSK